MTEAEWLRSMNPHRMLALVREKGSGRLWRLFAVACARRHEKQMRDRRSRAALGVAERFADGKATLDELRTARHHAEAAARQASHDEWVDEARANFCFDERYSAMVAASAAADIVLPCLAEEVNVEGLPERLPLPDVLREIFGNPFRWKLIDPVWLSLNDGAPRRLAETIYESGTFDLMPILADALEEAGCTDEDILTHLRGPEAHVRGCWALDLLLGKE